MALKHRNLNQREIMDQATARRSWLRPLLITLGSLAAIGTISASFFFAQWTDVSNALPPEAKLAFEQALVEAGGDAPYIEIIPNGETVIHRDLEPTAPTAFNELVLLAWSATDEKIVRLEIPRWFVRMKLSTSLNLATMVSLWLKDWDQMGLSVSFADLERRGPGLLLDHQRNDGGRILLWLAADRS